MNILRKIGGVISLVLAAFLAFDLIVAFSPVVLPTFRQLGQEQTQYFVLRFAGLSLTGWQILVFEGLLPLLTIGLVFLAFYAFKFKASRA